jgi:hypothetical protein
MVALDGVSVGFLVTRLSRGPWNLRYDGHVDVARGKGGDRVCNIRLHPTAERCETRDDDPDS